MNTPGKLNTPEKSADPKQVEEVTASVKLPKNLHAKLTKIAAAEGVSLTALLARAARDLAASYVQTSKTVTTYERKKTH